MLHNPDFPVSSLLLHVVAQQMEPAAPQMRRVFVSLLIR